MQLESALSTCTHWFKRGGEGRGDGRRLFLFTCSSRGQGWGMRGVRNCSFLQTLARGWENAVNISARWLYGQWRCWEGVCFKLLPPLLSGFRKAVGQCQDLSFLPVLAGRPEGVANVLICLR